MITPKDIEHLSNLARIKLTDEDKKSLVKEFDSILGYIDQLKRADVKVETESRVGALTNVMREDIVRDSTPEERDRLLGEVPHRIGDYVAVKKIIAQD